VNLLAIYLAGRPQGHKTNWINISTFFVCHAPSPERRTFEGSIVRTSIALPFIARFRRGFQHLFQKGLLFQKH